MELLFSSAIGVLIACGVYLILRARTFPVVLGMTLITYAVNLYLLSMGRLEINKPPLTLDSIPQHTDPLPQALVLTAIVISFGMTAVIVVLSLRTFLETDSDHVDLITNSSTEFKS
jgi:multicomponent K+:H+ antiporter subunit C